MLLIIPTALAVASVRPSVRLFRSNFLNYRVTFGLNRLYAYGPWPKFTEDLKTILRQSYDKILQQS